MLFGVGVSGIAGRAAGLVLCRLGVSLRGDGNGGSVVACELSHGQYVHGCMDRLEGSMRAVLAQVMRGKTVHPNRVGRPRVRGLPTPRDEASAS